MAVVVVVVRPLRESEDRRAGRRRPMRRAHQVEQRRIGKLLPATIRAAQRDPAAPHLSPRRRVLPTELLESGRGGSRSEPHRLPVRLVVRGARDHARQLPEPIGPASATAERVVGRERRILPGIDDRARGPAAPSSSVLYAMPTEPMSPSVAQAIEPSTAGCWLAGRRGVAAQPPSLHARRVDGGSERDVGGRVKRDRHLLQHH